MYELNGCNVGVLSSTKLVIEPFEAWLWDSVAGGFNGSVVPFTTTICVDMTTIGLNGVDASPGDGVYMVYMLQNPTTGDVGFLCSRSISWSTVVKPSGYTKWRKLPYGVTIRGGKLLENHTTHWPLPKVILTDVETNRIVFSGGATGGWTLVNLSGWIPENSRLGHFRGRCTGNGTIWISPSGAVPNLYFRTLLEGSGTSGVVDCRVAGGEYLYVWTYGSGVFQVFLEGWSQTEVS